MLPSMYILMYLQTVCFTECFITPITVVWKLPSLYTLMHLQIIRFTECIIKHTTAVCTFHYVKKKKGTNITILKRGKNIMKCELQISYTNIVSEDLCSLSIPLTH